VTSVVFYLLAYILTNLAAFGIVMAFGRVTGSDEIKDYAGMSRRSPGLAIAMLVAFLSLAGMPPFGGFVAKVFVFAAAVQVNMVWLAVVGILNSIIGLYYYLTVLKVVYLYRMEGEDEEAHPIPLTRPYAIGLVVLDAGYLAGWHALCPVVRPFRRGGIEFVLSLWEVTVIFPCTRAMRCSPALHRTQCGASVQNDCHLGIN
jgi:NADH:ubiquinone oxidoreductase subunit 2 (subunit N)